MKQFDKIDQILLVQDGLIQTSDVLSEGISKPVFYDYVQSRQLEKVAHGIYSSKDAWVDSMYILQLRFKQAIYSHDTALYFHDLTDREPLNYTVTLKTGYNPTKLKEEGVSVFTVKPDLYEVGRIEVQTPFGNTVVTYDMERTICDIIRSKNKIEVQTFQDAIKSYALRKDKDLHNLMHYAQLFRIEKKVRLYLELLL